MVNWGIVVDEVQRRVSWREEAEERATVGARETEREWKERRMRARSGGWQRWIRFISRWEALAFPASDDLLGYNVVTHDLSLPTRWLATTLYLISWLCMRRTGVSRELYTLSLSLTHVLSPRHLYVAGHVFASGQREKGKMKTLATGAVEYTLSAYDIGGGSLEPTILCSTSIYLHMKNSRIVMAVYALLPQM